MVGVGVSDGPGFVISGVGVGVFVGVGVAVGVIDSGSQQISPLEHAAVPFLSSVPSLHLFNGFCGSGLKQTFGAVQTAGGLGLQHESPLTELDGPHEPTAVFAGEAGSH